MLPRDSCTPSVVGGACGQDAASLFHFSSLVHPPSTSLFRSLPLFSCMPFASTPLPHIFTCNVVVYTVLCVHLFPLKTCVLVADVSGGIWRTHETMHALSSCTVRSTLFPLWKCVVMTLTVLHIIGASQCRPLVHRPPLSPVIAPITSRGLPTLERMLVLLWGEGLDVETEEYEEMTSKGCLTWSARMSSSSDCWFVYMKNRWKS